MKKSILFILLAVLVLSLSLGISTAGGKKGKKRLPDSLSRFYPPKAQAPVYLIKMFEMEHPLTAVLVNLTSKDFKNVEPSYVRFAAVYKELSGMVPEWKKYWPMEPVEELGAALKSGDQGKVMGAVGKVFAVCSKCHYKNMVPANQAFSWGNFAAIRVIDPVTDQEKTLTQYMQGLSMTFGGIGIELMEGQKDRAVKMFEGFQARFQALKNVCGSCHTTERKYFIDDEVQNMVDALGAAVKKGDGKSVQKLSMIIGNESCRKCHLVHVPAAFAQKKAAKR